MRRSHTAAVPGTAAGTELDENRRAQMPSKVGMLNPMRDKMKASTEGKKTGGGKTPVAAALSRRSLTEKPFTS